MFQSAESPPSEKFSTESFRARDGAEFSFLRWTATGGERFRVFVLHGMGATAYEFDVLGQFLARHGGTTFALNQRANGLDPDPRRRGHSLDRESQREDFLTWMECIGSPQDSIPEFFCGESLGALLGMLLLTENPIARRFRGAIFLSPVVELAQPTPRWVADLLMAIARVFPRLVIPPSLFIHGKTGPPPLTRDPAYEEHVWTSPHRVRDFTVRYTAEVGRIMRLVQQNATHLQIPFLLLSGGKDVFIREEQSRQWFSRAGSIDKTHEVFPEAYHLLLHDLDAHEALGRILGWISARIT